MTRPLVGPIVDEGGEVFDVKGYGALGTGGDDGPAIRAAIAAAAGGGVVYLPPGTYGITSRLDLLSNQTLSMAAGATLRALKGFAPRTQLIRIRGVTDVVVQGGTVDGNKAQNGTAELLGIQVFNGAARVAIRGVHVQDVPADVTLGSSGDGIYIGASADVADAPTDVSVEGCTVDGCVRQAISVTAGVRVRIVNNSLTGTTGDRPGAAVDIEPNEGLAPCTDIVVEGNVCTGNQHGVMVATTGVRRVAITGNLLSGKGDDSGTAEQPSYGILVSAGAQDVVAAANTISEFRMGVVWNAPRGILTGNRVMACRYGLNLQGEQLNCTGNEFSGIWGECAVKVQAHDLNLVDNQFYNCVDAARLAALGIAPIAVVVLVDEWLHPTLAHNVIRDDRASVAPAGFRLSGTPRDLNTYLIGTNQVVGPTVPFTNTATGAVGAANQPNLALGPGTLLLGGAQGNLLTPAQAAFDGGVTTGWTGATGCTIAASTDVALQGTYSLKSVATATGGLAAFFDTSSGPVTATPGETYTAMLFYRTALEGAGLQLQVYGTDGTGAEAVMAPALNALTTPNSWQRAFVTVTVPASYGPALWLRFRWAPHDVGDVLYVDQVSIAPGVGTLPQSSGQAVAQVGPTGWLVGGGGTTAQPLWFGARGAAPVVLNGFGGTGGTAFGDGVGNTVAQVDAAGVLRGAGLAPALAVRSGSCTLTSFDSTLVVDAGGGAATVTLPAAGDAAQRVYTVKKGDATGNGVTLTPAAGQQVDGAGTYPLTAQYQGVVVQSDGSGWQVIGKF